MKLIKYDGVEFKIADEALLIRPIRELFRQDKSKKKEEFWKQISYLWFMCDPRSTYQYLIDENERAAEIKRQEGLGEKWKPSALLQEAMDVYKRQTITTASLLLEDMRYSLETVRAIIRQIGKAVTVSEERTDEEGTKNLAMKLDKALDSMTKAADKIPDLAKKFVQAEKELAKDFEVDDKARGSSQKAIGEDV